MIDKQKTSAGNEIAAAVWSMRRIFFAAGAFTCVINLLMLVPTLYMLQVYDRVLTSRNTTTLVMITILTLALYGLMGTIEWVRSELLIRAGARFDNRLKNRAFTASFESRLRGATDNPAQALNDLGNIRQFMTAQGIFAFFDAPWAPIFMLVIFILHPLMGLVAMAGIAVLAVLALLTELMTRHPLAQANRSAMQASNFVGTNMRNAEVIEALGMLEDMRSRWHKRHRVSLVLQQVASDRAGIIGALSRTIRVAQQSAVIAVGAVLVIDGTITPGAMIAASILIGRTMGPIEQLIGSWKGLISARGSYDRLCQLLHKNPERDPGMPLPAPSGQVQVENVGAVSPQGNVTILQGLNFALAPGEVLGIVGPSASGKSVLARMLVGIWPTASGCVRLDGADVYKWNKLELGKHLGYLPQDIELFEGTVAENIARFATVDADAVVLAAQRAGIHEMILRMPEGYQTKVGEGGSFLSGGQRQRVALARAIYNNPRLIVLDEPNSNLDEVGESALTRTILDLKANGCTVVVISHRTGAIAAVDKLLVLREGKQVAFGPRDDVLTAIARMAQQAQQQAQQQAAAQAAARAAAQAPQGSLPGEPALQGA